MSALCRELSYDVQAEMVVEVPGAGGSVSGPIGMSNGPVLAVPVTSPLTVAEPPTVVIWAPMPIVPAGQLIGVITGRPRPLVVAVKVIDTLSTDGTVVQLPLTHTVTGTFGTETGPRLIEAVAACAGAATIVAIPIAATAAILRA